MVGKVVLTVIVMGMLLTACDAYSLSAVEQTGTVTPGLDPVETPTLTLTPDPSLAQAQSAQAGYGAQIVNLAMQITSLAVDNERARSTEEAVYRQTAFVGQTTGTAAVATSTMEWIGTATQAMAVKDTQVFSIWSTNVAYTATLRAATVVAINEQMIQARDKREWDTQVMRWSGAVEIWLPAVACLGGLMLAFFTVARLMTMVESHAERQDPGVQEPDQGEPLPPVSAPRSQALRVEIAKDNGLRYLDLPGTDEQLRELADGILQEGVPFRDEDWMGDGKTFSRGEWYALRQVMIERGLADWKNQAAHNQGAELTPEGEAVLDEILKAPPHPSDESAYADDPVACVRMRTPCVRTNAYGGGAGNVEASHA
jgi:hypothetical protein